MIALAQPSTGQESPAGTALLHLEHITKQFGGVKALDDVRFEIRRGEVLCLAGENGCGKSTLIKIISGVHQPEKGATMLFEGRSIEGLNPSTARQLGIQVIWQDLALFPEMSVAENISFESNLGTRPRLVNYAAMKVQAERILERLGVRLDLDALLRTLPIAQRQVVAIARALIGEATLVFMDEPTASLSQAETDALLVIVRRLSAEGIAVVFVSHRLAEVLDVCSRVTVIRDGRYVGTFPTQGMTQTRLTELMTGKTFDYAVQQRDLAGAPVILSVKNLSRAPNYADISFTIRRGEIVGLTGRLGSGRTELALSLFGMSRPTGGEITLEGRSAHFKSNREAIRAGVAYVSEDRLQLGLVQPQSIADNTVMAVLDDLIGPDRLISMTRRNTLVDDWIRDLAVKIGHPENAVSTLSGGNQQRVVLAKWLATNPKLLILDSPTVGVDVGARAGIFAIVHRLAEAGMAILLISDEIPEVYFNADRILHMRDGRIVGSYVPGETEIDAIEEAVHA
ncbi:sugar ABC transporter ATP-binding protein [Lichenifustis flavocetrariae]|uniref:Sugar ABC transporter ATP-binding protein n=1 Tax=Lichenifustis flavocetrariae TaxID=2949735 RepID=A0AA41Z2K0_9HYPH|nr:sugar ABC transporter ATP-binding protein [Lichenifustis flavocetrariae]MCW6509190.1 sugar ABC transporter ATP-binding protein [Lichenifustis flavocetrariae]